MADREGGRKGPPEDSSVRFVAEAALGVGGGSQRKEIVSHSRITKGTQWRLRHSALKFSFPRKKKGDSKFMNIFPDPNNRSTCDNVPRNSG